MTKFLGWTAPNGARVIRCDPAYDQRNRWAVDFDRAPCRDGGVHIGRVFNDDGTHRYNTIGKLVPPRVIDPTKLYKFGRLKVSILSTQACEPRSVVVMTKSGTILGVEPYNLKEVK